MDNKKKSHKSDEKDENKKPIGKRHDDIKPKADNNRRNASKTDMSETDDKDEKRIEIDDNPEETERKIPRMKH